MTRGSATRSSGRPPRRRRRSTSSRPLPPIRSYAPLLDLREEAVDRGAAREGPGGMRGGAIPLLVWGMLLLVLARQWIWDGRRDPGRHVRLRRARSIFACAAAAVGSRRVRCGAGRRSADREPEAVPQASLARGARRCRLGSSILFGLRVRARSWSTSGPGCSCSRSGALTRRAAAPSARPRRASGRGRRRAVGAPSLLSLLVWHWELAWGWAVAAAAASVLYLWGHAARRRRLAGAAHRVVPRRRRRRAGRARSRGSTPTTTGCSPCTWSSTCCCCWSRRCCCWGPAGAARAARAARRAAPRARPRCSPARAGFTGPRGVPGGRSRRGRGHPPAGVLRRGGAPPARSTTASTRSTSSPGLLLWWPLVDGDPAPRHRLGGLGRLVYMLAAMAADGADRRLSQPARRRSSTRPTPAGPRAWASRRWSTSSRRARSCGWPAARSWSRSGCGRRWRRWSPRSAACRRASARGAQRGRRAIGGASDDAGGCAARWLTRRSRVPRGCGRARS